jgi:hypothetical protein
VLFESQVSCKSERPLSGLETSLLSGGLRYSLVLAKVNDRLAVWRHSGLVPTSPSPPSLAKVNDRLAVWMRWALDKWESSW